METTPRKLAGRVFVYAVLLVLFQASQAQAQLPDPSVMFIPDKLSAESSFVMIADPGSVGGSVRMNWVVGGGFGNLPYINGKYMCYFSDTDYMSTCGPSPFRFPTMEGYPEAMDVSTFDSQGNEGNTTIEVEIGGLKIVPDITVDFDSGTANMLVYTSPSLAESIQYRVYDSQFSPKTPYASLKRMAGGIPYFNGSVELDPGVYYIAFKASKEEDFGGGIIRVNMGGGENGGGVLQAEALDINVVVVEGSSPPIPYKRIANPLNQSFTGVSISLPSGLGQYLSITISNSTINPYETVYYTVSVVGVTTSMDIDAEAEIKSGEDAVLGTIPIKMKISYVGGATEDCTGRPDLTRCLGGICCSGACLVDANCCSDTDCQAGESCSPTTYRCLSGSDVPCTIGTCRTDALSCPSGQEEVGSCMISGVSGICCSQAAVNECEGMSNTTSCNDGDGVCCDEDCKSFGECCVDSDCDIGEECSFNSCYAATNGEGGFDILSLVIIVALLGAAAFFAWWFLTKKKKKTEEEEFEESKEEEDVLEGEEEFY